MNKTKEQMEQEILNHLMDILILATTLSNKYTYDVNDFRKHIQECQRIIVTRKMYEDFHDHHRISALDSNIDELKAEQDYNQSPKDSSM